MLNDERLNVFFLRTGIRQLLTTSIQHTTGGPSQRNKARKINKMCKDCKGRYKTLFADDMMAFVEIQGDLFLKKPLEQISMITSYKNKFYSNINNEKV